MSIIPEVIIHNVIVKGLREIRKDPRILDVLFSSLDQSTLQSLKDTILKKSINFTVNYPRGELKLPTIALLMKTEKEAQTFLGDIMGAPPHYGMPDQEHTIDTLGGHGSSTTDMQGLPVKVVGGLVPQRLEKDATNNTTTVFWIESQQEFVQEVLSQFAAYPSMRAYISSGTGAGQIHNILRIDNNSLDIEGVFDPQLDSSSVIDVRLMEDTGLAIGEPSRVYSAGSTNLLRRGANFQVQYQLSVIAGHQDEVLYLYTVLKGLLFSQKRFMEQQGMLALSISGSDFAPRTEFLPTEVFQRMMILDFTYPFSFMEEQDSYSKVQISLTPTDPVTGDVCDAPIIEISFEPSTLI